MMEFGIWQGDTILVKLLMNFFECMFKSVELERLGKNVIGENRSFADTVLDLSFRDITLDVNKCSTMLDCLILLFLALYLCSAYLTGHFFGYLNVICCKWERKYYHIYFYLHNLWKSLCFNVFLFHQLTLKFLPLSLIIKSNFWHVNYGFGSLRQVRNHLFTLGK